MVIETRRDLYIKLQKHASSFYTYNYNPGTIYITILERDRFQSWVRFKTQKLKQDSFPPPPRLDGSIDDLYLYRTRIGLQTSLIVMELSKLLQFRNHLFLKINYKHCIKIKPARFIRFYTSSYLKTTRLC